MPHSPLCYARIKSSLYLINYFNLKVSGSVFFKAKHAGALGRLSNRTMKPSKELPKELQHLLHKSNISGADWEQQIEQRGMAQMNHYLKVANDKISNSTGKYDTSTDERVQSLLGYIQRVIIVDQ